jgi:hypothetical protein
MAIVDDISMNKLTPKEPSLLKSPAGQWQEISGGIADLATKAR